jgi:hypothetical protein
VGIVIVLLAAILFQMRDDSEPEAASTVDLTTGSASPSPRADPSKDNRPKNTQKQRDRGAGSKPAPDSSGPGDVRALPAGLFCRDLDSRGYSYTAAVDYWRMHGQPNQMDIDLNGIPCETVYAASDVAAYWGGRSGAVEGPSTGYVPAGLFCRDLYARGVSYPEAVAYWWSEGAPDRMDEDLNGIPCETVYAAADVSAFWYP